MFSRYWIYSHHIYSKIKRRNMLDMSKVGLALVIVAFPRGRSEATLKFNLFVRSNVRPSVKFRGKCDFLVWF